MLCFVFNTFLSFAIYVSHIELQLCLPVKVKKQFVAKTSMNIVVCR